MTTVDANNYEEIKMQSAAWKIFIKEGVCHTNEELLQMMQDTVDAANALRKISPQYYQIVTSDLLRLWQSLELLAYARKMDYPLWI